MDIICAKTGKHFYDVGMLKECEKHCESCSLKIESISRKDKKPKTENDLNANVVASEIYISKQTVNEAKDKVVIELLECPNCSKKSLSWYEQTKRYECGNRVCKWTYTRDEYEEIRLILTEPDEGIVNAKDDYRPQKKKIFGIW